MTDFITLQYLHKIKGVKRYLKHNMRSINRFTSSNLIFKEYNPKLLSQSVFSFTISKEASQQELLGLLYNIRMAHQLKLFPNYHFRVFVLEDTFEKRTVDLIATLITVLNLEKEYFRKKKPKEFSLVEVIKVQSTTNISLEEMACLPLYEGCETHVRSLLHRISVWDEIVINKWKESRKVVYTYSEHQKIVGGKLVSNGAYSSEVDWSLLELVSARNVCLSLVVFFSQIPLNTEELYVFRLLQDIISDENQSHIMKVSSNDNSSELFISTNLKREKEVDITVLKDLPTTLTIIIGQLLPNLRFCLCNRRNLNQFFTGDIEMLYLIGMNEYFNKRNFSFDSNTNKTSNFESKSLELFSSIREHKLNLYKTDTLIIYKSSSAVVFNDRIFIKDLSLNLLPVISFQQEKLALTFSTSSSRVLRQRFYVDNLITFTDLRGLDIIQFSSKPKLMTSKSLSVRKLKNI